MAELTQQQIQHRQNRYFVRGAFHRFYIPAMLSTFWLAVAGVADSVFVGNGIGARGLAAISLGQPVYLFYNILSYGFSIGGSIHYAAKLAEGCEEEGRRIFLTIWKLLLFLYLVTVTLGLVFLPQLMKMLGADPADSVTRTYIRTQLIFVPIMFSQGPFYFFVNADNGPKTASIAMSLSGITDAVFSYIFVIRMKLGVAGSVYSTVVGALLMLAITGSHIARKKGALRFCRERMDWAAVRQAAHTGFATSLQYVFQFITMIAVNRLLVRLGGPVAVAAFDVVYNISLLCNSVSEGAVFAMEPMISSYRSERNLDNMRITLHMGFRASMVLAFLFGCLLSVYSPQFSMFFGMKSGIELEYTAEGIHLFALCVLPATANILFSGYYQAALQEWLAYLITFLRSFLFYLTALFLCTRNGMQDFWFIFVVVEMLTIIFWVPVASLRGGILQLKGIRVENAKTVVIDSGRQDIHEIVEQFQEFSEAHGADARQSMYIALTIEEICCALIDRFRDKMGRIYIQVTAVVEDGDVTLHLRDNAMAYNPFEEDTEGISLEEGKQLELVGLRIVQKKAKEFYYRSYSGFNTLVIRL